MKTVYQFGKEAAYIKGTYVSHSPRFAAVNTLRQGKIDAGGIGKGLMANIPVIGPALTAWGEKHFPGIVQEKARQMTLAGKNTAIGGTANAIGKGTVYVKPGMGREGLAHELFHARHPLLGMSENLAYFYGGYKAPRGAGFIDRLKAGYSSLNKYRNEYSKQKMYAGQSNPLFSISGIKSVIKDPVGVARQNAAAFEY